MIPDRIIVVSKFMQKFVGRGPVTFIPNGGKEKEMILFLVSCLIHNSFIHTNKINVRLLNF